MLDSPDLPVPFDVRLDPQRERLVVVPRGELDVASVDRMEQAVAEQFDTGFGHVVVDLRLTELLMAAEHVMAAGNSDIVLCERGIRTFETSTRATLDVSAIPLLKEETHLPVIVDPSHGTGKRSLVAPMSLAAIAAGADGLMLEVHSAPDTALCDAPQTITPHDLGIIAGQVHAMSQLRGQVALIV